MENNAFFLENAIQENFQYSPVYKVSLANHLPMLSFCLFELNRKYGVKNEKAYLSTKNKLEPAEIENNFVNLSDLNIIDKKNLLGDIRLLSNWEKYYYKELSEAKNETKFICETLQFLSKGLISAELGHTFLRIVSALRSKEYLSKDTYNKELAKSFAYAASRYFPLSLEGKEDSSNEKLNIVSILKNDQGFSKELSNYLSKVAFPGIKAKIIRNCSEYSNKIKNIDPSYECLDVLIHLAKIAEANPNFVLLHAITVGHSLWYLENKLPQFYIESLKKYYAYFVLYICLEENLTALRYEKPMFEHISKESLLANFSSIDDEHKIKSLFALLELFDASDDHCFLSAAGSFLNAEFFFKINA